MIDEKDLDFCETNQPSKKIFPSYFLLDLQLNNEQRESLKRLIEFLRVIGRSHQPPEPKGPCPTCGNIPIIFFTDTWGPNEWCGYLENADLLEKLLEPNRWEGDHT